MQRFKITVSYDGSGYSGWQVQPDKVSVQGSIQDALNHLSGEIVKVHGSGRTDQGVHARKQVAHFDLNKKFSEFHLRRGMNAVLPEDIRVMAVKKVPDSFHARKSARLKEYRYFIWNDEVLPPVIRKFRTHERTELDVDAMQQAAGHLLGRHDFASFCVKRYPDEKNFVRNLFELTVRQSGREIVIIAKSDGFLYKMVRSIAGYLIKVGKGNAEPSDIAGILKAEKRTHHVETAPPQGLFLWNVRY